MGRVLDHRAGDDGGFGATALLFQRGGAVGRFTVQNLTARGALLTGSRDVRHSAPLRVLLELPSGEALSVGAHVTRSARAGDLVALAVAFRHVTSASEDRLQDALVSLLDASHRATHPAVLVVEASAEMRAELSARIRALGRRVLTAAAPLGALRVLDDPRERVDVVLVREGGEVATELLAFVADNYRSVRPVLYVDDPSADPVVPHRSVRRASPGLLAELLGAPPRAAATRG